MSRGEQGLSGGFRHSALGRPGVQPQRRGTRHPHPPIPRDRVTVATSASGPWVRQPALRRRTDRLTPTLC